MKQWKEALSIFQTAIHKVTSKEDTERLGYQYFHLANCFGQLGEMDKSLQAYLDATRINPNFAAAYTNMGTIYQGRKQNEAARNALELAVRIDGNLAEAYTNLGIALQVTLPFPTPSAPLLL
jgi:tetratricopeptide (TPR) repeat protein